MLNNHAKKFEHYALWLGSEIKLANDMAIYFKATIGKKFRSSIANAVATSLNTKATIPSIILELLESLHGFTLIHDDIVDNSVLRRGKPSLWKKFSNEAALLYGDYQHAKVFSTLATIKEIPEEYRLPLINSFAGASVRVQEGQISEIENSYNTLLTKREYYDIASLKTSSLIKLACQIGLLWANKNNDQINALNDFSEKFGIAFQIYNDLIDFEDKHGKSSLDDIRMGKMSLPVIIFCNTRKTNHSISKSSYKQMARHALEQLGLEIRLSGALDSAYKIMQNFINKAEEDIISVLGHIPQPIHAILNKFKEVEICNQQIKSVSKNISQKKLELV